MIKHFVILAAALLISGASFAQSDYDVSTDKETGFTVYKGQITFADLLKEPSFGWLQRGVTAYKPDTVAVKYLQKALPKYNIVVLMGTWCDDSQNLIPKLYKVLQAANFPMAQYTMFGVDHAKQTKNIEAKIFALQKVPTIILFDKNREAGRIVESVKKNIETDLMQLVQKDADANQ